jgi:hypothetical protein
MHRCWAASAFLALAVFLVLGSTPGEPQPTASDRANLAVGMSDAGALAARAGGFGNWWARNGKEIVQTLACIVDGAGLARLMGFGIPGVGGVVAAAAVVVSSIGCFT